MKDMFRLDDRGVVVVGAGSGIGEAVALACAHQGAQVACFDLDPVAAARVAEAITASGGRAMTGAMDICDGDAAARGLADASRWAGALHAVVCTPSINVRKTLLSYTDEEFDRVLRVNLKGNFNVLRAAGRALADGRGGSIVLFSSIRSQVVEPGQGVYAATKAGIVQLVRAAAAELGRFGIRVNAVAPGVVETPLTAPIKADPDWYRAYAAKSALGRWAVPEEMAWPTVYLLSDAASYVTGSLLVVDGGWLAIDGRFTPPGMRD